MPIIRLEKASVAFGSRPLLEKVDFIIDPGERVGLVGLNGAGKSTLMKVITGEVHLDGGEVWVDPGCKISVLDQILPVADERKVWDVVAEGLAEAVSLRKDYDLLVNNTDAKSLKQLEKLQHQLEAVDGWMLEQKVERVLTRLKLNGEALMSSLSGGWRRRAALGAALVTEPQLLLLAEPTNHLDISTIEWLEKQLLDFKGGLLFVSHDRSMVNALATRIIELDRGVLTSFTGNYDSYVQQKEILLEQESRNNALFDKRLAEEEVWIRQGIKARRTRNEGRVRALQSLRNERSSRLDRQGKANFSFEEAAKSGKLVACLEDVSLSYADKSVIKNFDLTVQRGDRIGLIGPNGAGKSSLLKLILGETQPDSGKITFGTKIEVAYFDQLRGQLEPEKSVVDNIAGGREMIEINGRNRHVISYLNDFLFAPERARTPVKALSGGECNRVLLAKLFSLPANVLVMDEPTNDLDVETLELLEEILLEFKGTVLLVSHDRAFLDNVVTSTLVFEGEGVVSPYVGGYQDWLRQRPQLQTKGNGKNSKLSGEKITAPKNPAAAKKKLSYKLQHELDQLPLLLEKAEAVVEKLQQKMAADDFYQSEHSNVAATVEKLAAAETEVETLMERWLEFDVKLYPYSRQNAT
ncbi:MAG: ATP-binding cassette domain-containing protein [Pseudomonadales bacterium]|nr:ATP-binding cassette domain-containing protein [Pseudomonadales bacterium]